MLSTGQIILITLLAFLIPIDKYGLTIGLRWPIISAFIVGFILGDMQTALYIGGTLQLMSLGVASIGGSSVPEYATAAVIATTIAVTTGKGMEAGLAIGLPVAMLGVQLDVFAKILNGFVGRKSQQYANEKKFRSMINVLFTGPVIMGLTAAIPVFVAVRLGPDVITGILNFMPKWFSQGLTIAGKVLPAVGIALLLNYMPVKKYMYYLIGGFFLAAYLQVPILGVTIVGIIAAMKYYSDHNSFGVAGAGADYSGGLEDE
ncbi:PTS mannose/fructose/sorbose/N-acetylgalactosamine transporter subunit IIC [Lacrimispora indolis]|uniref:PTS mannose/fructose/sorbose/N-acetylgalactosamine transporter subunit IIC n=1 Tax=Lacrimispora indolis TaxID=69825 RepID=UPI0004A3BD48|nr:PTS sugar transporter subunit IIC [Lacrimispora indolis]